MTIASSTKFLFRVNLFAHICSVANRLDGITVHGPMGPSDTIPAGCGRPTGELALTGILIIPCLQVTSKQRSRGAPSGAISTEEVSPVSERPRGVRYSVVGTAVYLDNGRDRYERGIHGLRTSIPPRVQSARSLVTNRATWVLHTRNGVNCFADPIAIDV